MVNSVCSFVWCRTRIGIYGNVYLGSMVLYAIYRTLDMENVGKRRNRFFLNAINQIKSHILMILMILMGIHTVSVNFFFFFVRFCRVLVSCTVYVRNVHVHIVWYKATTLHTLLV